MDELKRDIREMKADLSVIKEQVIINTADLKHHIKRTDVAEARIEKLEYWLLGLLASTLVAILIRTFTA